MAGQGLDAGPHTICWHLARHHGITVSPATVWRYLNKAELIEPQPKAAKSSYIRSEAALPNETWQTDFPHRLADGTDTEVLSFIDDS